MPDPALVCRTGSGVGGRQQPYTEYRTGKPDSPGYTPEQKSEEARLRGEVLQLSITVSTHPYWRTLEAGTTVDARMALKHIHDQDPALTDIRTDDRSLQSL